MSWPYLHTVINHIPIVLVVVGALAIFLGLLVQLRGIWLYGLTSLTLAGLGIYPAWITGDRAAHAVKTAWYVAPGVIQRHADAAGVAVWIVGGAAFIALIALFTMARLREAVSPARWLRWLVGLAALADLGAVSYTGYLGGKVVVESPILMSPTPPAARPVLPQPSPAPATLPQAAPATAPTSAPTTGAPANQPPTPAAPTPPAPQTPPQTP
ncbi:MAG TPA: hypothetical protein VGT98_09740 [Candidatus Elarobacter sp.]|nr:hypothetical protein [Candidatus Elarobacter sp.]